MATYPIEIVNFGNPTFKVHENVIEELNNVQSDVQFLLPREAYRNWASPFERESYLTSFIWEKLDEFRRSYKGFHPYIIGIVHGALQSSELGNLFGSHEAGRGLAVVTTKDWEAMFAPPPLSAYLAYYFVRYTLSFICPQIKVHQETRGCWFDKKEYKQDIKISMSSGRICDQCREVFDESVDSFTYESLRKLVTHVQMMASGEKRVRRRPRIFIGSSTEGLRIAKYIQLGLEHVAECTIWSQGVFGLSSGTLEDLVKACKSYEYAILVLTPDDLTVKRGTEGNTPRDNVLFELGLFMGALGRDRTFMVRCRDEALDLPTDLAGVSAATYGNRSDGNLEAAIGSVCTRIEKAVGLL